MSSSLFQILNVSRQDMMERLGDLDVVSNNLANVNTSGYKSNRTNFQEVLSQQKDYEGINTSATQLLNAQGAVKSTGIDLDVAISGDGYFSVKLPNGQTGYTRDGEFQLDANNRLTNANGYPLNWSGSIPANAEGVKFDEKGGVWAKQGQVWSQVGTVSLSRFTNPSGLLVNGDNVFLESAASGKPQTGLPGTTNFGKLIPGSVETSNVDISSEMTHLMTLERNFQMSTRTFQQTDEMITEALQMRKG